MNYSNCERGGNPSFGWPHPDSLSRDSATQHPGFVSQPVDVHPSTSWDLPFQQQGCTGFQPYEGPTPTSWDHPTTRVGEFHDPCSYWEPTAPRGTSTQVTSSVPLSPPSSASSPYEFDPILGRPRTSWDLPRPRIAPESCSNPSYWDYPDPDAYDANPCSHPSNWNYSDPYAYDPPVGRPLTSWDLPRPRIESYGGGGSSLYMYGASRTHGEGGYAPSSYHGGGYSGGGYANESNSYAPPPPPPQVSCYVTAPQPNSPSRPQPQQPDGGYVLVQPNSIMIANMDLCTARGISTLPSINPNRIRTVQCRPQFQAALKQTRFNSVGLRCHMNSSLRSTTSEERSTEKTPYDSGEPESDAEIVVEKAELLESNEDRDTQFDEAPQDGSLADNRQFLKLLEEKDKRSQLSTDIEISVPRDSFLASSKAFVAVANSGRCFSTVVKVPAAARNELAKAWDIKVKIGKLMPKKPLELGDFHFKILYNTHHHHVVLLRGMEGENVFLEVWRRLVIFGLYELAEVYKDLLYLHLEDKVILEGGGVDT